MKDDSQTEIPIITTTSPNQNTTEIEPVVKKQQSAPDTDSIEKSFAPETKTSLKSLLLFAVIVMAIVLPIRIFIAKPFIVSGTSMYPTFDSWHYLIVDQLDYRFNAPQRGDVIIFHFPPNPSKFLIKRIIGLPGETLYLKGTGVTVVNKQFPKGKLLAEPYVKPENQMNNNMVVHLKKNEYFVLGDNRKVSADSRYWGPLKKDKIVGRAYLRIFPIQDFGVLPGAAHYTPTENQKK